MPKFKQALERGMEARREKQRQGREENAGDAATNAGDAVTADFGAQAKLWLDNVVVASLETAKAEVVGDMTIQIETEPRRVRTLVPSVRFQIYRKRGLGKKVKRRFKVSILVGGNAILSAPGMVAKDVGNIGERSDARFRSVIAELIEDAAKSP